MAAVGVIVAVCIHESQKLLAMMHIFCTNPKQVTGNFFIDEDVVQEAGATDLVQNAWHPENADQGVNHD